MQMIERFIHLAEHSHFFSYPLQASQSKPLYGSIPRTKNPIRRTALITSIMSEPSATPSKLNEDEIYSGLPPNYQTIQFSSYERVEREMNDLYAQTPTQYIMLTSITKTQLDMLYTRRSAPYFRADYFPEPKLSLIRTCKPRVLHNGLTHLFVQLFDKQARKMGMDVWTYHWGRNTIHTTEHRYKTPDECLFPRWRRQVASSRECGDDQSGNIPGEVRGRKGKWPTLVIETGLAESTPRLETDAAWWLKKRSWTAIRHYLACQNKGLVGDDESHGAVGEDQDQDQDQEKEHGRQEQEDQGEEQVNIVLLFKIDPPNKSFTIEKWESCDHDEGLEDDACEEPVTRITEKVTINRNGITGALHLPFHDVFNREPVENEQDLVFGGKEFYDAVWVCLNKAELSSWM